MRDKLGICQWFHFEAYEDVERCVALMRELGVRHLRTGISWADWHRPGGAEWAAWQMDQLADFDVLLSVWHTPPSISEGGSCASPPRRLQDYADFIDLVIQRHGDRFQTLELWNEPNNLYKWNFREYDPDWSKFARMIAMAAHWAKQCGKQTVLGGMIPVDPHWLDILRRHGVLEFLDAVAIHAFPGMWWDDQPCWDWRSHWFGWKQKLEGIGAHADGLPIWVTETGLATCDVRTGAPCRHDLQIAKLREAALAPTERLYWYCLQDLDPEREAIEGFHVDENEYHMGLVTWEGERKPAFAEFRALLAQDEGAQLREASK